MSYTPETPIAGETVGTPEAWIEYIRRNGGKRMEEVERFVRETYRLCRLAGLKAHLIVAQAIHETDMFRSNWWVKRLNPGGIGITGDPRDDEASRYFPDGTIAARAMVVHVSLYVYGALPDPLAQYRHEDPRADNVPATALGKRTTMESFGHAAWWEWVTWAADDAYGEKWARRLNAAAAAGVLDGEPAEEEEPPMTVTMIEHRIESAPRTIFLPDWLKVETRWVTHPRTTSRTRVPLQTRSTFHDTANPRTKARDEWGWLAGGRSGGSLGGYNAIVDDVVLIICQYLNEETWHAGTPEGNRTSWGTELAYGGNTDFNQAFENACAWHGALLEAADRPVPDACVLHKFWTGKWCSAQVLNRGLIPVLNQKVTYYYNLARAAREGTVDIIVNPAYATPVPVVDPSTNLPWDGSADVVINGHTYEGQRTTAKTTGVLNKRQWAGTESQLTGDAYAAGATVELLGWVKGELVDGISEWWVDTAGNRLWAGGIDAEPKQVPDWSELPSELPPGMTGVNGHAYYPLYPDDLTDEEVEALDGAPPPLGRKITVRQDGELHKWANPESDVVGAVTAGEERVFRYWTRGEPIAHTAPDGSAYEEVIWYAEDLHTGARMWSGLSDERPD